MSSYNNNTKYGNWPYDPILPTVVYHIKYIQLYPVTDSSTWPFPVRSNNADKFKQAEGWLIANSTPMIGNVDYGMNVSQTITVKFRNEEDLVAFTLAYGDLFCT